MRWRSRVRRCDGVTGRALKCFTVSFALCALNAGAVILSQTLTLPPREASAPDGVALIQILTPLPREAREDRIFQEVMSGNVPGFLRSLVPLSFQTSVGGSVRSVTISVTPDYLALGPDGDYFLTPMSATLAQRIADATGCVLPTRRMVDETYRSAPAKFAPKPIAPSSAMITVPVFSAHNDSVQLQRTAVVSTYPLGTLIGGTKKDIIVSNRIYTGLKPNVPKPVVIYGWHQLNGVPIQPVYNGHEETYADYSHGVRLVWNAATVDGQATTVTAILKDSLLHPLLSDEGVIAVPRYTVLPTGVKSGPGNTPSSGWNMDAYPNPFNPSTTIRFVVPRPVHVRVGVYDLLGRETAVVFDGLAFAGDHSRVFDAGALAGGVYVCRLDAAGVHLSRAVVLTR